MGMLACTGFFFFQRGNVPKQWQTSITIAGLVTGVAWYNYTYMKDTWRFSQQSPTVYRYSDWLITVPMQIAEFYFILAAVGPTPVSLFYKLMTASLVMLLGGWFAETDQLDKVSGFIIGMAGWLYILYEVFAGEAAALSKSIGNKASQQAFNTLKTIVSVGWSIYPLGYFAAYIFADLVNKCTFGMCIYGAAKSDSGNGMSQRLL